MLKNTAMCSDIGIINGSGKWQGLRTGKGVASISGVIVAFVSSLFVVALQYNLCVLKHEL